MELHKWEHLALAQRACEGSVVKLVGMQGKSTATIDEDTQLIISYLKRALEHLECILPKT